MKQPRETLARDASDIKITLARMEGKLDNCVTWKSAFAGLLALLTGLAGIAWRFAQQLLEPLIKAIGV